MTERKHTPAPWELIGGEIHSKDRPIASIMRELVCSEATIANARLIAAAPDLLEALEYLLDDMKLKDLPTNAVEKCLKAIKKAKGES